MHMVFENMLFLRPAYMTLSWNPTMTNDQIRQYLKINLMNTSGYSKNLAMKMSQTHWGITQMSQHHR